MSESDKHTTSGTAGRDTASGTGDHVKEQARQATDQAKDSARQMSDEARQQASRMADEKKGMAADQVNGVATALRSMADQLKEQEQVSFADYTYKLADQAQSFAGSLRDNDINTLWKKAQECSRHRPMVYLGGAIAAGFLLSRFMKSGGNKSDSTSNPSL